MSCGEIAPRMKRIPALPVGIFGDATHSSQITVNSRGAITNISSVAITASTAFSSITSGTNTTAAMAIGTGGSLAVGGGTTSTWNAPGHLIVNGADTNGIRCLVNANASFLTSICTSNTNTDHAIVLVENAAGSGSAGNAYVQYLLDTNAYNWTHGINNADSGAFVISKSATLGTSNVMRVDNTSNTITLPGGDLTVSRSASAANVTMSVVNTSSSSTAGTQLNITTGGTTAAGAKIVFTDGTNTWGIGKPTGSTFNITPASGIATNPIAVFQAAGYINYPFNCAFYYWQNGAQASATGDGTAYTIGSSKALTKVFDQNSNCTTAGVFTAPITGKYRFNVGMIVGSLTASYTLAILNLITTAQTIELFSVNAGACRDVNNNLIISGSAFVPMTVGDTATFTITVSGSTKSIGVGNTFTNTFIAANLVC